ncbi:DUF58 domain-containing protein [Ectothiorhodospiraceae bacterium 2226]|nr:DUF58 domain-containing protein [Ectothiorhodospiraceae bacterium 2226]
MARHPEGGIVVTHRSKPPAGTRAARLYALPTRAGALFTALALATLIGAVNYDNNLGYMLAFLLVGMGLVSLVHAYRNLSGLQVGEASALPVFAGEHARFSLPLDNRGGRARYGVEVRAHRASAPIAVDVPADGMVWVQLDVPAPERGRLAPGRITLATRFPLGIWRCLVRLRPLGSGVVYPKPAAQAAPAADSGGRPRLGGDDFQGFRAYRPGDPLRAVHWKGLAAGRGLLTREAVEPEAQVLWLELEREPADLEARLSELTAAVLAAHRAGRPFGLRLPDQCIEPGAGDDHRARCLRALALYGRDE